MTFFPSHQVFVAIGSLQIRWYAVLILTGALIAYAVSQRDLKRKGYDGAVMDDLFIYCLVAGVIGSRLWYVLFYDLKGYLENPVTILQIWRGGLAIQGGVLAGILVGYWYCRKHHYDFMHVADGILPNVLLAQALGRWGNFANYECYGPEVPESYFRGILALIKNGMYINGAYRMPMFFYESVLCVLGWFLIRLMVQKKKMRGAGVFGYLAWYGAIRIFIEHYRTDSLMIGSLKTAQVVGLISMLLGLAGLLGAFKKLYYPKAKPAVIFDFDGTLMDTAPAIYDSFEKTFQKYVPGLVLSEADKASLLGPTLEESFERFAPGQDTAAMVADYRAFNAEAHQRGLVKPVDHVPELLEYLKQEGYPMAIASAKRSETVKLGLQAGGISEDYFPVIIGGETLTRQKPDKEVIVRAYQALGYGCDNIVYIGDSVGDMQCARNAGAYSIAHVYNELVRKDLEAVQPNRIVDDMLQVRDILKEDHLWTSSMM